MEMSAFIMRLPEFLTSQRWYGDKASEIRSLSIVDSGRAGDVNHLIVEVQPAGGAKARYYVPLLLDGSDHLTDAVAAPAYHRFLAEMHRDSGVVRLASGQLIWRRSSNGGELTVRAKTLSVEQSNSSVKFGDAALVKVFRRLQAGVNPEIELTQFLTGRAEFHNAPALLGWLTYEPVVGDASAVAVAQSFVPSVGDGWTATLGQLRGLADDEAHSLELLGLLGARTAQMHLALASDPWTPDLAPEKIDARDVERWRGSLSSLTRQVDAHLNTAQTVDERTADLARAFVEAKPRIEQQAAGFEQLIGSTKTRVHGDYHLGQTLLTPGDDWFILDFEGEPRRGLAERRAKTSPLKDVAGMLRSFSYARGTAERESTDADAAALVAWERGARQSFLERYLAEARAHHAAFLPAANEDVRVALIAWELDKAIYEIDYELNNRPDWLWLPLSAALKFA